MPELPERYLVGCVQQVPGNRSPSSGEKTGLPSQIDLAAISVWAVGEAMGIL